MKILKQLFIASCIFTATTTQPALWEGVNYKIYHEYVSKAKQALNYAHDSLQFEIHGCREILCSGKEFADVLYLKQKAALQFLLSELKLYALRSNNQRTYELFISSVYSSWKQEFKKNYAISMAHHRFSVWEWLHEPVRIYILE